MTGGVVQVVEHLPSKCEALSSNQKKTAKQKENKIPRRLNKHMLSSF
jgi:hypothetical protein